MRIGRMRHQVTIQEVTETRDAYGGVVETWSDFKTVWASVEPLIGREYMAAKQTQAEVTHKIRLRYLPGIIPKMRISWAGRLFDIESIINVEEQDREIVIMAKEAI